VELLEQVLKDEIEEGVLGRADIVVTVSMIWVFV
jgi:hypothetical protein